jgi:hypothetical protein
MIFVVVVEQIRSVRQEITKLFRYQPAISEAFNGKELSHRVGHNLKHKTIANIHPFPLKLWLTHRPLRNRLVFTLPQIKLVNGVESGNRNELFNGCHTRTSSPLCKFQVSSVRREEKEKALCNSPLNLIEFNFQSRVFELGYKTSFLLSPTFLSNVSSFRPLYNSISPPTDSSFRTEKKLGSLAPHLGMKSDLKSLCVIMYGTNELELER